MLYFSFYATCTRSHYTLNLKVIYMRSENGTKIEVSMSVILSRWSIETEFH